MLADFHERSKDEKQMNRIDRLTAMLLLLQSKKRTAGELARRFEVSRRTVLRDIQALGEMGIPVTTDMGASGGYTLPPDYSLPPLALTQNEALLLLLAVSSVEKLSETPFKQERESLLAKIQTLLPRSETTRLAQLTQKLALEVPSQPYPTPFLERLLECAREQRWIAATYRSERGTSEQTLLPLRIRTEAGLWYCEAFSAERQETRVYRVDRFLAVKGALPPEQTEQSITPVLHVDPAFPEVRVHLTARGVLRLAREPYLARRLQAVEGGEGLLSLHLRPDEYDWLTRILLSLGTDARVLAPESLLLRMQQAIQDLAHHYNHV